MSTLLLIASELLGSTVLILIGLYIYYKYVIFNFWKNKNVYSPDASFPTGHALPLITGQKCPGEMLDDLYKKNRKHPFFGIYVFFKPNLVVNDLDLVRFVLTKEFGSFHDRGMYCNESIDPLSGHLFLLPGKKWRNLRVKLTPTFTSGKIKQMFQVMKESGDLLTKFLEKEVSISDSIEIKDIFARFSTDIIMNTAFGINSNSLENPDSEFRYWGKKIFESRAVINTFVMFAPKVLEILAVPFTPKGVTKFFMNTFKETVKYRETHSVVRKDFMNLIIQLMKNGYVEPDDDSENKENGNIKQTNKLSMEDGAAQAYVFFLAGFETSSTTATYCLYELALHQDIQEKARKEINETLKKHGGITYDSINDMSYLSKVINEALRKYPPVPVLNRVCTKEVELPNANVVIPEGTMITIPVLGIQRDPSIYPDPEKFDPERFNEQNVSLRHSYAFIPFGEGPRICIGMRFGLVQTKIALVNALKNFRFKPSDKTQIPIIFDGGSVILAPLGGIHLNVERI